MLAKVTPGAPLPTAADLGSDTIAILAQQQILIATQAQMVRDLEDALSLSPPPPVPPAVPAPPPAGTNTDVIFTIQAAAIRMQASYIQQLLDLQGALTPPARKIPVSGVPPC